MPKLFLCYLDGQVVTAFALTAEGFGSNHDRGISMMERLVV